MERADDWGEAVRPHPIVDAGGEEWPVVRRSIERRMDGLAVGDLLEVISGQRRNRADIPTWCFLVGHDLVRLLATESTTWFWIRKAPER